MIRRLTTEDLPFIFRILDSRTKLQLMTLDSGAHDWFKQYYAELLSNPNCYFFGRWEDGDDRMRGFISFTLFRQTAEVVLGASWKLRLEEEEPHAAPLVSKSPFDQYLLLAIPMFRKFNVDTYWRMYSIDPDWHYLVSDVFDDETKFKKIVFERLEPRQWSSDTFLNMVMLPRGPFTTAQEIVKYVDLNPIKHPKPGAISSALEFEQPPRVPIKEEPVKKRRR